MTFFDKDYKNFLYANQRKGIAQSKRLTSTQSTPVFERECLCCFIIIFWFVEIMTFQSNLTICYLQYQVTNLLE